MHWEPQTHTIFIFRPVPADAKLVKQAREWIAEARATLAQPLPSTFIGSRCEPLVKGNEVPNDERWFAPSGLAREAPEHK